MSHWRTFLDAGARGGRYLPWKEVARATGLSRTTAWRLQKRDDFPAPYAISPGRVGYREDEVEAWGRSRDHGGVWSKSEPTAAGADEPQIPAERPAVAPTEAARSRRAHASPAPATPPLHLPGPAPGEEAKVRGARNRRRSQHAQAIAQQMLLDF